MAVAVSPYFDKPYIAPRDNTGVQIIQEGLRDRYRKRQAEEAKRAAASAKSEDEYNTLMGSFAKNEANLIPVLVNEQNADTSQVINKIYDEKKKAAERGGIFSLNGDLAVEIAAHNARKKAREAFSAKHRLDIEQYQKDASDDNFKVAVTPEGVLMNEYNASGTNPERRKQIEEQLRGTNNYTLPFEYNTKEKSYGTIQDMMQETAKKLDLKPTVPREVKGLDGKVQAIEMDFKPEDRRLLLEQTLKSHPKAPQALSEHIANIGMANASDDQPEKQQAVLDLTEPFLRPQVNASFKPQPSKGLTIDFGGARKIGNDVIGLPVELSNVDMPRADYVKLKTEALRANRLALGEKGTGDMSKVEKSYGELYDKLNSQTAVFYPVKKYSTNEERERAVTLDIPSSVAGKNVSVSGIGEGFDIDGSKKVTAIRISVPEKTIKAKNKYDDDVVIPAYRDIIPATAENWAKYTTSYPGALKVVSDDGLIAPVKKGESGSAKSAPAKTYKNTMEYNGDTYGRNSSSDKWVKIK